MSSTSEYVLAKADWELLLSRVRKQEFIETIKLFKRNGNRPIALEKLPLTCTTVERFRRAIWQTQSGIAFRVVNTVSQKGGPVGLNVYQKQKYRFLKKVSV